MEQLAHTLPQGTYIGRVAAWSETGSGERTLRAFTDTGMVVVHETLNCDMERDICLGDTIAVEVSVCGVHVYVDVDVLRSEAIWRPGRKEPLVATQEG